MKKEIKENDNILYRDKDRWYTGTVAQVINGFWGKKYLISYSFINYYDNGKKKEKQMRLKIFPSRKILKNE